MNMHKFYLGKNSEHGSPNIYPTPYLHGEPDGRPIAKLHVALLRVVQVRLSFLHPNIYSRPSLHGAPDGRPIVELWRRCPSA